MWRGADASRPRKVAREGWRRPRGWYSPPSPPDHGDGSAHPRLLHYLAGFTEPAEKAWSAPRPRPLLHSLEAGISTRGRGGQFLAPGSGRLGRGPGRPPPPRSPPPESRPRPARCGAGAGRGPGSAAPAPFLNIDAARVGVALLPLSEAVSRGLASA